MGLVTNETIVRDKKAKASLVAFYDTFNTLTILVKQLNECVDRISRGDSVDIDNYVVCRLELALKSYDNAFSAYKAFYECFAGADDYEQFYRNHLNETDRLLIDHIVGTQPDCGLLSEYRRLLEFNKKFFEQAKADLLME